MTNSIPNAVQGATLLLVGAVIYSLMTPPATKKKLQNVDQQTPGGAATGTASGIHVDPARETVHRNDAVGGTPDEIDAHQRHCRERQAEEHPGVRQVLNTKMAEFLARDPNNP